jgi:UPF0288 family protein (methanogenesis marker protein 3)
LRGKTGVGNGSNCFSISSKNSFASSEGDSSLIIDGGSIKERAKGAIGIRNFRKGEAGSVCFSICQEAEAQSHQCCGNAEV